MALPRAGKSSAHATYTWHLGSPLTIISTWQVGATIVCALIPWGILFAVIMRIIGLAVFGPHMHWVGRCVGW